MSLIRSSYGKGRVRVLRLHRDGEQHEVRETAVKVLLEGAFDKSYTEGDNLSVIATDSIKNLVNITARQNLRATNEALGIAIGKTFLDRYSDVERANVEVVETQWQRLSFDGTPHGHSFTKSGNGNPVARIRASRGSTEIESGVDGFTFMKTTGSGWVKYVMDDVTTLPETEDRIAATSMNAIWRYTREPSDFPASNAAILQAMLKVFATTYSKGVQDSMYRMGLAALAVVPEISEISMAMPNKHYLLINLAPFKLENSNVLFVPTDEPHGQIECTVGRD
jgi:urate oxidase